MFPILYEHEETAFQTNGLGRLSDATACTVTEQRNGSFELALTYPVGGLHWEEIQEGRIIYAPHDDYKTPQPFEIYNISKPTFGKITARARHIVYRTSGIVITPWNLAASGSQALTPAQVFAIFSTYAAGGAQIPFIFDTDITQTANIIGASIPATLWSLLGDGNDNSILANYDGDYQFDKWRINLWQNRGVFSNVKIRRGKNTKSLVITSNNEDKITAIIPYWQGTNLETGADEMVSIGGNFSPVYADPNNPDASIAKPVDFADSFEEKPTEVELATAAAEWLRRNTYNTSDAIHYDVQIVTHDEETEELQQLHLCDDVILEDAVVGIRQQMKIIGLAYDVIKERVTALELGTPRRPLSMIIKYNNATAQANAGTGRGTNTGNTSDTSAAKQTRVNASKIKALEGRLPTAAEDQIHADLNDPTSELAQAIAGGGGGGGGDTEQILIPGAYAPNYTGSIVAAYATVPKYTKAAQDAQTAGTTTASLKFHITLLGYFDGMGATYIAEAYWDSATQIKFGTVWVLTNDQGGNPLINTTSIALATGSTTLDNTAGTAATLGWAWV